jgi:hypothetical protein
MQALVAGCGWSGSEAPPVTGSEGTFDSGTLIASTAAPSRNTGIPALTRARPTGSTPNNGSIESGATVTATSTAAPTATESTGTSTSTSGVGTSSAAWDVKYTPPSMSGPREIEIPRDLTPVQWPAYSVLCSGKIYQIKLNDDEDAIIRFKGSAPLRYPLWVDGGRNVRLIGLHMDLEVQPGCGVGELPNIGGGPNVHPRVPGGIALRLEQWRTSFVEGAYLDLKGTESDCFVIRNPDSMSASVARSQRDIVIQNSACHGISGLGLSDIGDGIHGDILQNQGDDVMRRVIVENLTARSASEGIVLHENQGYAGAVEFVLRRFDYSFDSRYTAKTKYDGPWGLALHGFAENFQFEEIWLKDYRGADYVIMNNQRYGVSTSSSVLPHAGIRSGLPPTGAFAPAERIGANYLSPHP